MVASADVALNPIDSMKDSGVCTKILGIRVTWKNDRITLIQRYYSERILMEFGMQKSRPATIPLGKDCHSPGHPVRCEHPQSVPFKAYGGS